MNSVSASRPLLQLATPLQASQWSMSACPIWGQIHLVAGMLYVFLMPLWGPGRDAIAVALLVITLIRLAWIASVYLVWFRQPIWWAILVYLAWMCVGLTWTSDFSSGLVDLKKHRMLLSPLLLLPLLSQASYLIWSYLAGVGVVNLIQIMEWLHWPSSQWFPATSRPGGLNNPIPTGLFIAVALCYWLRLLLFGSWRIFLLVLPVLGLAGFGLILTNSKGPLLGALVGLVLVLVIPFVMRPHLRSRVFIITVLLVAAFVLSVLGTARSDRPALMGVPDAFQEYTHPGEHPGTSGGLRIQMLDYGYSVIKAHPILGTGPGAASRYMSEDLDLHGGRGDRVTLHNTYLLAAVTLGIPGLLLLLWVLMAALWSAAPLAARTGFLGGTFYGLVVWIVAAVGDSYQGSGNFMGILGFLITIGLLGAPLHTTEPCLEAR